MPSSIPKSIGDFAILPLTFPPLPSYPHTTTHHLYVRRHSPKIAHADDARSLFVNNVPVDSTEPHFRAIIASLVGPGRFESICFEADKKQASTTVSLEPAQAARVKAAAAASNSKKRKRGGTDNESNQEEEQVARLPTRWTRPVHRSGSTAVIVLADAPSVEQVLKAITKAHRKQKFPVWGEGVTDDAIPPLGFEWLRAHEKLCFPPHELLQQSVDAFFTVYNRREAEAAALAKRMRSEPDEDGFVTVTRGASRVAPARSHEAEEAKRRMLEKEAKKKEEMGNFYRFQLRERRKAEQAELVKKFDEDRKKVQAMRQNRGKFRPET